MPELMIYQIDAFTQELFKGNPAAVVPLDAWLPDGILQHIASENNLAETAFFVPTEDGYHIRWFTPIHEAPLCGHATLASAYVLFNELNVSEDTIHFTAQLGDLYVQRDDDLLILDFPAIAYAVCDNYPQALIDGIGIQPIEVYRAEDDPNYYAILENEADVLSLNVNLIEIEKLHPYGIPEDPVTGSIHCVLTPFWQARLNKHKLHALQASPRTGELFCSYDGERVKIGGYARKYLQGKIQY